MTRYFTKQKIQMANKQKEKWKVPLEIRKPCSLNPPEDFTSYHCTTLLTLKLKKLPRDLSCYFCTLEVLFLSLALSMERFSQTGLTSLEAFALSQILQGIQPLSRTLNIKQEWFFKKCIAICRHPGHLFLESLFSRIPKKTLKELSLRKKDSFYQKRVLQAKRMTLSWVLGKTTSQALLRNWRRHQPLLSEILFMKPPLSAKCLDFPKALGKARVLSVGST